jgi:hypothetical protein
MFCNIDWVLLLTNLCCSFTFFAWSYDLSITVSPWYEKSTFTLDVCIEELVLLNEKSPSVSRLKRSERKFYHGRDSAWCLLLQGSYWAKAVRHYYHYWLKIWESFLCNHQWLLTCTRMSVNPIHYPVLSSTRRPNRVLGLTAWSKPPVRRWLWHNLWVHNLYSVINNNVTHCIVSPTAINSDSVYDEKS